MNNSKFKVKQSLTLRVQNSKLWGAGGYLISHPLFAGSFVMIFGNNVVNFGSYLYHLLMGRLLGPVAYGELGALIAMLGILGMIPASLTLAIVKFIADGKQKQEIAELQSKPFLTFLG